jgi:deferrochelatase/peroxidase EfeB
MAGITRRGLLAAGGASVAGAAVGYALGHEGDEDQAELVKHHTVPFHGRHQAGIATAAQDRLHIAAFDLTVDRADEVRELLRDWTTSAALMTQGRVAGVPNNVGAAPPADTGEALDLTPAKLTITFGLGPGLFERDGEDRFGLAAKKPALLRDLPRLPGDELERDRSGGDLVVQACADDPQVAFHAVRNLARIGRGSVVMRWSQLGFGRTSTTSRAQATPRNLMGFKDGTNNIRAEDTAAMRQHVWLGAGDDPAWMRDGTFMVTRRIRMLIEVWDRASLADQEDTIGRLKTSGAPIGGHREFDEADFNAKRTDGEPRIPVDAHIRLAAPQANGGERILRRGYSFTDGMDAELGQLDAGLFFICFQRDPFKQFVEIQRRLGTNDALNEYIKHTSSGVFAVPPGVQPGGYVAQGLFEA